MPPAVLPSRRAELPIAGVRASESTPRMIVPIEHFAAAFVWYTAASIALVHAAPFLAGGAYGASAVLVPVHMLTLGFVLTVITGVLQQFAPVGMGVAAKSERIAHIAFGCLVGGTLMVVLGMGRWSGTFLGAGWTAIVVAVCLTWHNLIGRLGRAPRGRNVARAVRTAFLALGAALGVALARIGNVFGWWAVSPRAMVAAHVHLALGGFATVIAMGVGSTMLPTFLTVRTTVAWAGQVAWRSTAAGAALVAAGALLSVPLLTAVGAASFAVGIIAWLTFVGVCFVRRGTRAWDNPLALIAAAHVSLAGALVGGLTFLFSGDAGVATAYVMCGLLGWLGLFITGAASRIIPMVLRAARMRAGAAAPASESPALARLTRIAVASLIVAALALPAATVAGSVVAVRAAAIVQVAGVVLLLTHHALLARSRA